MKRRTLDLIFSTGGLVVAILLMAAGFVFLQNASFAKDYVHDQLTEQRITFTPANALTDRERQQPCLLKYAGEPLDSGKKAECYANSYIRLHLSDIGNGETYATIGAAQRKAQEELTAAQQSRSPNVAQLQAALDTVNAQRDNLFRGETLRGLLLTSYGFSIFGEKAYLAAVLSFLAAVAMLVASIAGYMHATRPRAHMEVPKG